MTLLSLSFSLLLGACSNEPTLGDNLISQGESTRALGEQWNKGTSMIEDGEKMQKKGRKMVKDGEKLIRKGEKSVERGKELKAESEAAGKAAAEATTGA
ncbi:MAG: hypothetical protein Q7R22_013135 [Verrucomicrobiota bacterium JB025]|nr:hypothetical protein [Verrucomicrobiota bacterium JB025]